LIRESTFVALAKKICEENGVKKIIGSNGWIQGFKKRFNLVARKETKRNLYLTEEMINEL